jgi:hypothetical protein
MSHYGPGPAGTTEHRGAPGDCADPNCAPPRTAAATAARRRQGEERAATMLRKRGWLAIPPEYVKIGPDLVSIERGALSAGAGRG